MKPNCLSLKCGLNDSLLRIEYSRSDSVQILRLVIKSLVLLPFFLWDHLLWERPRALKQPCREVYVAKNGGLQPMGLWISLFGSRSSSPKISNSKANLGQLMRQAVCWPLVWCLLQPLQKNVIVQLTFCLNFMRDPETEHVAPASWFSETLGDNKCLF